VFVAVRDEMTYLPRISDEHRPLLGGWFIERDELWVSEEDGRINGFFSLKGRELSHINVEPDAQNRGVGAEMLAEAKRLRPEGLELWVFQKNEGARRFYERQGFELVKLTDGAENMEREPDALYAWRPA
jgi:ribosomal protein S18 acetylase RimI-like enzyme